MIDPTSGRNFNIGGGVFGNREAMKINVFWVWLQHLMYLVTLAICYDLVLDVALYVILDLVLDLALDVADPLK